MSNGFKFVTRSCANTKEMGTTDDGRELPLFKLDTTSESHPFYTGTQKSVDNMSAVALFATAVLFLVLLGWTVRRQR